MGVAARTQLYYSCGNALESLRHSAEELPHYYSLPIPGNSRQPGLWSLFYFFNCNQPKKRVSLRFLDVNARQVVCNIPQLEWRREETKASVCVTAGSQLRSQAWGGGVSSGSRLLAPVALTSVSRGVKGMNLKSKHTRLWGMRRGSRPAGAERCWWVGSRYEWKRTPHFSPAQPPPQPTGQVHGLIITRSAQPCTKGHAQWKQFAHYAFIEAQPFITFIPCLCPNESREQGWNVKTLWRLFLRGELRDPDNTDKAAAEVQSGGASRHTPQWLLSPRFTATLAAETIKMFWANSTLQGSFFWAFISWPQLWDL